jgi:2-polyprenyl-6-methoxyphenol hydroxylase-like FAD-dependent oxidoreductase
MKQGERAITIGASMSGMLAARVLAEHFHEVIVLERDTLPPVGENRRGVPQGRHAHALLASGLNVLEAFFPGFTGELVEQGALSADISRVRWFDNGGYHARCTGLELLLVSRPLLEAHVRTRFLQLPNVRVIEGCAVQSLVTEDGDNRVTGVRIDRPSDGNTSEEVLTADLVVDASGRGSQTPMWLEALGFPRPKEDVIQVDLGYATRIYQRHSKHLDGDVAMLVVPTPPSRRGAVMLSMEHDRWMLTLIGMLGDHPPTEEQEFLEFARGLPAPEIYETIEGAEPLSSPLSIKFPASSRRRYERMPRFPEGYLVFGDAICSFNPIYGQGMSSAALQAVALKKSLVQGKDGVASRFFPEAAKVLDGPWTIAVGGDLRYPTVEGPRTPMVRFINWYLGKLHIAARRNPHLTLAFQKVAQLLSQPPSLLHPKTAFRVLRGNLFGGHQSGSRESA